MNGFKLKFCVYLALRSSAFRHSKLYFLVYFTVNYQLKSPPPPSDKRLVSDKTSSRLKICIRHPTPFPGFSPIRPPLSRSVVRVGENPGNEVVKRPSLINAPCVIQVPHDSYSNVLGIRKKERNHSIYSVYCLNNNGLRISMSCSK